MIVADICAGYGYEVDYVLNGGYYKAHRLWDMLLETKANDLFELAIASAMPSMAKEGKEALLEHLKKRQHRRHPPAPAMPPEVWEKFRENFEKAGNAEEWLKTRNLLST